MGYKNHSYMDCGYYFIDNNGDFVCVTPSDEHGNTTKIILNSYDIEKEDA